MPDKTIYIGLFEMPTRPTTDTTATFSLYPATGHTGPGWPSNTVITTSLDGGTPTETPVSGKDGGTFVYDNLSVGDHTWHASVVGDNIATIDNDPGFDYAWSIIAP